MLGLALFDALSLAAIYNITHAIRLEEQAWVGINRALALLILALVLGHSWVFQVANARTRFRMFLVPMLGITALLSGLAQLWLSSRHRVRRRWLMLGDGEEMALLRTAVAGDPRLTSWRLLWTTPDQLANQDLAQLQEVDGIAVSDRIGNAESVLQALLAERATGTGVSSLVNWSEQHLQRVPPELFSNRWLLQAEGFGLQPSTWSWRLKRSCDLLGASLLGLLTLPLILAGLALIIRALMRPPIAAPELAPARQPVTA
jgi:hypothetical protein